jgi:hypothetical protein
MELKKGIMLFNECDTTSGNITINAGILPSSQLEPPKVAYGTLSFTPSFEEKAFLPKKNWRPLTGKEISFLKPTERRTDTNTIYTGNIPGELITLFEKVNLGQCTTRAAVFEKLKENPDETTAINKLMEVFLTAKANGKPHKIHYLGTNLPNLETVACDTTVMPKDHREEDKKYMGIHNDGTYYVPFRTIRNSGNRLTINLGKESRYFLFVNLTMQQAYNMLRKHFDLSNHTIDVINISKYFFACFPDYPVLRIEQKPYEYYIAPTDNCFHDGCTLGKKELDILLVYFGAFRY